MRWLAFLLLLLPVSAAAETRLADVNHALRALDVQITDDAEASKAKLTAAVETMRTLAEAVRDLPEGERPAGIVRLVEGHLRFGEALVSAPCPKSLDATMCSVYLGLLAERAEPQLQSARTLGARITDDKLSGRDRRRLASLLERADAASARAAELGQAQEAPPPPREPGQPDDERHIPIPPTTAYAILWGNAELRTASGAVLRMYDFDDARRREHTDALYLVRVLSQREDVVELLLGGSVDWSEHCVGSQLLQEWAEVRVWAKTADLAHVLAEPIEQAFDDGTGYRLQAGTPLVPGGAWFDGQVIPLPRPPGTTRVYQPGAERLESVWSDSSIPWESSVHLGGRPLETRQPAYHHGDRLAISSHAPSGRGSLVTLRRKCGELRFSVPQGAEPEGQGGLLGVLGAMGPGRPLLIRAGTPLYWDDGTRAGRAARERYFEEGELSGQAMRCADVSLGGNLKGLVSGRTRLCARPDDVEQVERSGAGSLRDLFE